MRTATQTAAGRIPTRFQGPGPARVTLLEVIDAVCDVTDNDAEVVATVREMLRSGKIQLCGSFRGHPIAEFL